MTQNLHMLTTAELGNAYKAADLLCHLRQHLDPAAFVKLDTLRADLGAERDDRVTSDLQARREAVRLAAERRAARCM